MSRTPGLSLVATRFDGADGGTGPVTVTVKVMDADPDRPPLSLTDAVIVCMPALKVLVVTEEPISKNPSRLEDQIKPVERFPSCVSFAVPVKVTAVPCVVEELFAGEVMETVGGVLVGVAVTVTEILADPLAPLASVTLAVTV